MVSLSAVACHRATVKVITCFCLCSNRGTLGCAFGSLGGRSFRYSALPINLYILQQPVSGQLPLQLQLRIQSSKRYNDFVPSAIFAKQQKHHCHNLVFSSCVTLTKIISQARQLFLLSKIRPFHIIHPTRHRSRSYLSTFVLHKSSSSRLMGQFKGLLLDCPIQREQASTAWSSPFFFFFFFF